MATKNIIIATLTLVLLLSPHELLISSRHISDDSTSTVISTENGTLKDEVVQLKAAEKKKEKEECEKTYGFLPCTMTVFRNLFLVAVYGFLMFKAATFLSAGSELLLEILGPGIIGGLFLPILGALPDAMLILERPVMYSGAGGSSWGHFKLPHQVNLEYMGKVVFNKEGLLCPDSVVGIDSHTTMIDGLDVAGWGVGGIKAEATMLGQVFLLLFSALLLYST